MNRQKIVLSKKSKTELWNQHQNFFQRIMREAEKMYLANRLWSFYSEALGDPVAAHFLFEKTAPFPEVMLGACLAMLKNAFAIAKAPVKRIMHSFVVIFVINGLPLLINLLKIFR